MLNRRLHRVIISGITGIVLFSIAGAWLLISRTSLFFALWHLTYCLRTYFAYYFTVRNASEIVEKK